jgi:hypothetical protein
MLHIRGIDHTRFTYPFRGLDTKPRASKKHTWLTESSPDVRSAFCRTTGGDSVLIFAGLHYNRRLIHSPRLSRD